MILIALLSTIAIPLIASTNMANANFFLPPSNPNITFDSPVNTTYTTKNVILNVIIATNRPDYPNVLSRNIEYSVDGKQFQPITITNATIGQNRGERIQFDGIVSLYNLTEGNHKLTVKADLDYYNNDQLGPGPNEGMRHTESIANAYLIIDASPDNTPTPPNNPTENNEISPSDLVIPIIAAITIIAVSISVYYLRIKR